MPIQFLGSSCPIRPPRPADQGQDLHRLRDEGREGRQEKSAYIYNICDHEACYAEVGSQAISYTTGVPAMIGAMMMVTGKWMQPGVWNMEQLDPDPFMEQLNLRGLPWVVQE
ncbi:MAG: saccharopine dehydrogenase family protein [Bilophila wadsworthia]